MTVFNIDRIKHYISKIPFVKNIAFLERKDFSLYGKVEIAFDELVEPLDFDIVINPQYPFKNQNSESIKFINPSLIKYNHVMSDGSICIHTSHNPDIEQKLSIDFNSLKNWIVKYYINNDNDLNYEHIIVPEDAFNDVYHTYIFTDLNYEFKKGDFGDVKLSYLNNGIYKEKLISNFLVHSFVVPHNKHIKCEWSNTYLNYEITHNGFYIFIENTPAKLNRFAFQNWIDFKGHFSDEFLMMLHLFENDKLKQFNGSLIPVFIGYKTIESEIHWQIAMLEIGKFPFLGVPERINGVKTGKWKGELIDEKISWALSRNSSYKYFFGRGTISEKITSKKILIIGIGAIGSMIAKTLVRGGCKYIDIADYDVKEPENVCRSEYIFNLGLNDKVQELIRILTAISPFLEIAPINKDYFENIIKVLCKEQDAKIYFASVLNQYDIIFDCSTDNDLMYVLNSLELSCDLINVSITNHAKDLVCAFHPNVYQFVNTQFSNVLENDIEDLYNPTGCWSPTFKASYNDINVLVQLALKHINILYHDEKLKKNFIIKTNDRNVFNIKIEEY